jgi:hypothetical protein
MLLVEKLVFWIQTSQKYLFIHLQDLAKQAMLPFIALPHGSSMCHTKETLPSLYKDSTHHSQ